MSYNFYLEEWVDEQGNVLPHLDPEQINDL